VFSVGPCRDIISKGQVYKLVVRKADSSTGVCEQKTWSVQLKNVHVRIRYRESTSESRLKNLECAVIIFAASCAIMWSINPEPRPESLKHVAVIRVTCALNATFICLS
jgi:hypothetical protein